MHLDKWERQREKRTEGADACWGGDRPFFYIGDGLYIWRAGLSLVTDWSHVNPDVILA